MVRLSKPLFGAVLIATSLALTTTAFADHHGGAAESATEAGSSMTEKAKQAGAKGASTGADSMLKGATVEDSAKKGGAAAIDDALQPAGIPAVPAVPGAVSTPPAE